MAHPPIHFVISAPRSGSTWLTHTLNQHPDLFATEHRLFGDFAEVWKNNNGTTSPRVTLDSYAKVVAGHYFHDELGLDRLEFADEFIKSYVNSMCQFALTRSGKPAVIDKITPYPGTASQVSSQISKLFPQSKVIQLVRDGRDVLTSGTFDWLKKDAQESERYRFFVERSQPSLSRFFDDCEVTKWANNWIETLDIFDSRPPSVRISYESMQRDFASELSRLCQAIGVSNDHSLLAGCVEATTFEKMTGRKSGMLDPTAKARQGTAGDWKNYFTRSDAELFDQLAGESLRKYGYEIDATWIESCPEHLELTH